MFELFTVKDTHTGEIYNQPVELVNDCIFNIESDYYLNPSSFTITTRGELIIIGRVNERIYLDNKRFKPIFNNDEIIANYETWR